MGWHVLAFTAVALHFAFLAFGVLGGFLAWRWPWLLRWQVAGATWLVLIVALNFVCPLTWVEDRARERAGLPPNVGGFIENWVAGVFFPRGHQPAAMVVAGLVVLISWVGYARIRRRAATRAVARPRS